jgi:hypothetical protein
MKYRYLRIAFSAVCGIVCLLLIVLWVRSYFRADYLVWYPSSTQARGISTIVGSFMYLRHPDSNQYSYPETRLSVSPVDKNSREKIRKERADRNLFLGFGKWSPKPRVSVTIIPLWFPALLVAAIGIATAAPWIRQCKWRFSLRTLLIAMTLVAVVLGMIIYASR